MKRRDFITLGSALFAPRIVFAQDASRTRRLGVLSANPREVQQITAFFDELNRLGFIEGSNLLVDFRRFARRSDELAGIAAGLGLHRFECARCGHRQRRLGTGARAR